MVTDYSGPQLALFVLEPGIVLPQLEMLLSKRQIISWPYPERQHTNISTFVGKDINYFWLRMETDN